MASANGVVYAPRQPPDQFHRHRLHPPKPDTGTGRAGRYRRQNTGRILLSSKLDSEDFGSVSWPATSSSHRRSAAKSWRSTGHLASRCGPWQRQAESMVCRSRGRRLLVPVGLGATPMLVSLKLGAAGSIAMRDGDGHTTPSSSCTPSTTALCISTSNQGNGLASTRISCLRRRRARHAHLQNDSAIPHDWHSSTGQTPRPPSNRQYGIKPAPMTWKRFRYGPSTPGRYFFQCDVHPTLMTGFLVVR